MGRFLGIYPVKGRYGEPGRKPSIRIKPKAGIGASMAMESAAALADELSRADAGHVENALHLYVTRRRKRVEGMQMDSRHLAKMMLVESQPVAWTRDQLMRFNLIDMLIKNIAESFSSPI